MTNEPAAGSKRVALAAVAGPHGVHGELRLKLFSGSVESLTAHSHVWIDGKKLVLLSARAAGKGALARIEGIDGRACAESLRGSLLEVERSSLPALEEGEYYHADLVGLTCFTTDGDTVGSVIGVENYGAGDLLDIELVGGKRALIPFKDGIADLVGARVVLDPQFLA